jgi:hypothetical protein
MTLPAEFVRENDIVAHKGAYYTVAKVVALLEGDTALYTKEQLPGGGNRLVVPRGAEGVAVYRPRHRTAST